ncbi:MAG: hypothetical protein JXQ87_15735 [Bacteroidia bacterium]
MKKALILFLILSTSSILNAQKYPEREEVELGFNAGILQRFHSNYEQGRDEEGSPAFRLGVDFQRREKVFLGALSCSIEHGGFYQETYLNISNGYGLALFYSKDFRIDILISAGADLSPQISGLWFRPALSGNLAFYHKNLRISLSTRTALGIFEGYGETGITIGYLLRQGI